MRFLPNLEYLNGLPVDRDALDDDDTQNGVNSQMQKEPLNDAHGEVTELPAEEEDSVGGYDDT